MAAKSLEVQKLFGRIMKVCQREFPEVGGVESKSAMGVRVPRPWQIDVVAHVSGFMVCSSLKVFVPAARMREAAELVNRVNVMTLAGMLEVSIVDNQLRLRHCLYAPPAIISCGIIRALVRSNVSMAEQAIPKLKVFIEGELSPQQVADAWVSSDSADTIITSPAAHPRMRLRRWPPRTNQN